MGRPFEPLGREERIDDLLGRHEDGVLFLAGCVANQGRFGSRYDAVVLLSAPADVILERVAGRDTNDYGKTGEERDFILRDGAMVEPLLRRGATAEIDARAPLADVVTALERIGAAAAAKGAAGRLGSAEPRTRGALGRPR
jgi:hypothetical protein